MSVTRQQVVAALDGLRHGRQGHTWRAYVRSLLRQHGGGAVDIDHLPPKYFESVWRAAGGALPTPFTRIAKAGAEIDRTLEMFRARRAERCLKVAP